MSLSSAAMKTLLTKSGDTAYVRFAYFRYLLNSAIGTDSDKRLVDYINGIRMLSDQYVHAKFTEYCKAKYSYWPIIPSSFAYTGDPDRVQFTYSSKGMSVTADTNTISREVSKHSHRWLSLFVGISDVEAGIDHAVIVLLDTQRKTFAYFDGTLIVSFLDPKGLRGRFAFDITEERAAISKISLILKPLGYSIDPDQRSLLALRGGATDWLKIELLRDIRNDTGTCIILAYAFSELYMSYSGDFNKTLKHAANELSKLDVDSVGTSLRYIAARAMVPVVKGLYKGYYNAVPQNLDAFKHWRNFMSTAPSWQSEARVLVSFDFIQPHKDIHFFRPRAKQWKLIRDALKDREPDHGLDIFGLIGYNMEIVILQVASGPKTYNDERDFEGYIADRENWYIRTTFVPNAVFVLFKF